MKVLIFLLLSLSYLGACSTLPPVVFPNITRLPDIPQVTHDAKLRFSELQAGNVTVRPQDGSSIPEDIPSFLKYYSEYATLPYCVHHERLTEDEDELGGLCEARICDNHKSVFVQKIVEADITALILKDAHKKELILAFKGTSSNREWFHNIDIKLSPYTPYVYEIGLAEKDIDWLKFKVHRGFQKLYKSFHDTGSMEFIIDFLKEHPKYKVVVTGHSMGGAVSLFAATELYVAGYNPTVITFGAPKVFNKFAARWMDDTFSVNKVITPSVTNNPRYYRVVTSHDFVPLLPFNGIVYHHSGTQICISTDHEDITDYSVIGGYDPASEFGVLKKNLLEIIKKNNGNMISAVEEIRRADAHKYYPGRMNCKPEDESDD